MTGTTPPMPKTQAEWEAHWAFYTFTVQQRDLAWRESERLRAVIKAEAMLIRETLDGHT